MESPSPRRRAGLSSQCRPDTHGLGFGPKLVRIGHGGGLGLRDGWAQGGLQETPVCVCDGETGSQGKGPRKAEVEGL